MKYNLKVVGSRPTESTMNKYKIAKEKGYYINDQGEAFSKTKKLKLHYYTPYPKSSIYYYFKVKVNNKNVKIMVHRLQAYQKYGDELFNDGIVVRHLNGISTDNSVENIGIGTQQENMLDIPKELRVVRAKHASSFAQKHNHKEIYEYYLKVKSYNKTMEKFNISSKGTMSYIINSMKIKHSLN